MERVKRLLFTLWKSRDFLFHAFSNSVLNGFNDETFGFQTFIDYTFKYSENKRGSCRGLNSHTPDSKSDAHTTELSELALLRKLFN